MNVKMEVVKNGRVVERYIVPDGSWIQTDSMGAQYAYPVTRRTLTHENRDCLVFCSPVHQPPDIPEELLRLVNGRDKRWGRNGYEWLGKNRKCQGGTEIDRVREHANKALHIHGENPLALPKEVLIRLAKI